MKGTRNVWPELARVLTGNTMKETKVQRSDSVLLRHILKITLYVATATVWCKRLSSSGESKLFTWIKFRHHWCNRWIESKAICALFIHPPLFSFLQLHMWSRDGQDATVELLCPTAHTDSFAHITVVKCEKCAESESNHPGLTDFPRVAVRLCEVMLKQA